MVCLLSAITWCCGYFTNPFPSGLDPVVLCTCLILTLQANVLTIAGGEPSSKGCPQLTPEPASDGSVLCSP